VVNLLRNLVKIITSLVGLLYILARFPWKKKFDVNSPRLLWGPMPIINYKYWSGALKKSGYESTTLMSEFYASINKKADFDSYFGDYFEPSKNRWFFGIQNYFVPYKIFSCAINKYDIFHFPFTGGFLGATKFWWLEASLLKLAKCKSVVVAHGGDSYQYSTVADPSLRHGLLLSYPDCARIEDSIKRKVRYWSKYGDALITSFMMDGAGRWDCLPFAVFSIDCDVWKKKQNYSDCDGTNGTVKVIHAPNHRGFKGTEFIVQAVEDLQAEGLKVELLMMEKVPNEKIKELLENEVDILADQLIATGYAMFALEGMVCGLPVLSNLDQEYYTRIFRRYSYLNQCPILSTTPETVKENLRVLVTQPGLREDLGKAGRLYVEAYHSENTAQYMFGSIYDKIWRGKEVDLLNLFHPLLSDYNSKSSSIKHPLIENRLPADFQFK